jgi:hypothetical protein
MMHATPLVRRIVAATLAITASLHVCQAMAEPASAASIQKLLAVNGARKSLEQALAGMETQIRQQVTADMLRYNAGKPLTRVQQTAVDQVVPKVTQLLREKLSWETLQPAYIGIYKSQLDQAEVNRLIQLHQDPEYVRIVEKMQVANQQSARVMFEQVPAVMKDLQPLLEETVKKALAK